MSKSDAKRWPGLQQYVDTYMLTEMGLTDRTLDTRFAIKERAYDGLYVVIAWERGGNDLHVIDVASSGRKDEDGNLHWEMQNDSEDLTKDQWKKLYIPEECDWYRIKGEED